MRSVGITLLLFLAVQVNAQDSVRYVQKIYSGDTAWTNIITDADLILKVRIDKHYYMTMSGSFIGEVVKVVKGEFENRKIDFVLGMVEFTTDRYEKRFRALDNYNVPYEVYLGFMESDTNADLEDKKTGKKFVFFMSAKDLRAKKMKSKD
jgi:hypothetical protein